MKFAVFICTHGRPNAQHTLNAIKEAGYTGDAHLVVDDEDDTVGALYEKGYSVLQFCKQDYIDTVDIGRSDAKRKAILYAKCACEDFAKEFGYDAFVIADDDIVGFRYRYESGDQLLTQQLTANLNEVFKCYSEYILDNNICMTSFGTNQMYMGGKLSDEKKCDFRIPYNFLFRNTSIPFNWVSEMNEDTISVLAEHSGKYMIQLPFIKLEMKELMAGAEGGMTENYNSTTTAQRINTILMYAPSCVKYMATNKKITHALKRDNAFPKLISGSFKK